MPYKDPEKAKEYRKKNKEKVKEYQKEYYLKNREKVLQREKQYQLKNKEKIQEYKKKHQKEYNKSEIYKKSHRIFGWKKQGIIFHDWDLLYEIYLQTTHCDNCNCLLTYDRYFRKTTKCMDHDHSITDNENVRNILCHSCNNKRG